jgi:hypothetical protein
LGDDASSGLFVGWGRVYQHYWCVAKFIGEPPLQILVIHNAKELILWRELSPFHNLCHLDEKENSTSKALPSNSITTVPTCQER